MNLIDKDAFSKVMKKRQDACSEWVKEAKGNYRYRALGAWSMLSEVKLTLDKIPSIDAVEVKHGEWIQTEIMDDDGVNDDASQCSVCGYVFDSHYWANTYFKYCPNCGAKMDGERRDDGKSC